MLKNINVRVSEKVLMDDINAMIPKKVYLFEYPNSNIFVSI